MLYFASAEAVQNTSLGLAAGLLFSGSSSSESLSSFLLPRTSILSASSPVVKFEEIDTAVSCMFVHKTRELSILDGVADSSGVGLARPMGCLLGKMNVARSCFNDYEKIQ